MKPECDGDGVARSSIDLYFFVVGSCKIYVANENALFDGMDNDFVEFALQCAYHDGHQVVREWSWCSIVGKEVSDGYGFVDSDADRQDSVAVGFLQGYGDGVVGFER